MEIVVIDIETTGFSPRLDNIVEIGAVIVNTQTLRYEPLFDSLCNPGESHKKLKQTWICKNGYLTPEEILNAPTIENVAVDFNKVLGARSWTSFNLEFEYRFLSQPPWAIRNVQGHCLMRAMTPVCKIPQTNKYKWPKLTEAYHEIGGSGSEKHRALDDTIKGAEILIHLLKNDLYHSYSD